MVLIPGEKIAVLYIDDDAANLELFNRLFGHEVELFAVSDTARAREILSNREIHVVITDQRMPGESGLDFLEKIAEDYPHCAKVVLTAYADRHVMRRAFQTNRILDFIMKPFEEDDLREVFRRGKNVYDENIRLAKIKQVYENICSDRDEDKNGLIAIVGVNKGLSELKQKIERVSANSPDATVLLLGESGTGKELAARAIHAHSARRKGPFVAVNCPALSENLWESELFGHEKGAFSHAIKQKLGRFELADGGTLFLDEIGEIPDHLQAKLLRVLQERTFERVGGNQSIKVDVRIIAATNRDLNEEVRCGRFRADLFFRLNVVRLELPPLRDRLEDLPDLVEFFLDRFNRRLGKHCRVNDQVLQRFRQYPWPGNVRELENLIERAVILSNHDLLNPTDFIFDFRRNNDHPVTAVNLESCGVPDWNEWNRRQGDHGDSMPLRIQIRLQEVERYKQALQQSGGNISRAARILGIHRRTLTDRLRKADLI